MKLNDSYLTQVEAMLYGELYADPDKKVLILRNSVFRLHSGIVAPLNVSDDTPKYSDVVAHALYTLAGLSDARFLLNLGVNVAPKSSSHPVFLDNASSLGVAWRYSNNPQYSSIGANLVRAFNNHIYSKGLASSPESEDYRHCITECMSHYATERPDQVDTFIEFGYFNPYDSHSTFDQLASAVFRLIKDSTQSVSLYPAYGASQGDSRISAVSLWACHTAYPNPVLVMSVSLDANIVDELPADISYFTIISQVISSILGYKYTNLTLNVKKVIGPNAEVLEKTLERNKPTVCKHNLPATMVDNLATLRYVTNESEFRKRFNHILLTDGVEYVKVLKGNNS